MKQLLNTAIKSFLFFLFFFICFFIFPVHETKAVCGVNEMVCNILNFPPEYCLPCSDNCTTSNPGLCAKSTWTDPSACPTCGTTGSGCCGSAPYWSKWEAQCVNWGEGNDGWVWQYNTLICSTGDKCIAGETGLRGGQCDCSYGGMYKTCCNGTTPVACVNYSIQDQNYPPEGVCPSGSTTVFCGWSTHPACGQAACNTLAGPVPTSGTTPGGPTPTPVPPNNSGSGDCGEEVCNGSCCGGGCCQGASKCEKVSWGMWPNGNRCCGCFNIEWRLNCGSGAPKKARLSTPANGAQASPGNINFQWFRYDTDLDDCNKSDSSDNNCWGYCCSKGGYGIPVSWRRYHLLIANQPISAQFTVSHALQRHAHDYTTYATVTGTWEVLIQSEGADDDPSSNNPLNPRRVTRTANLQGSTTGRYYWFIRSVHDPGGGLSIETRDSDPFYFDLTCSTPTNTPSGPTGCFSYENLPQFTVQADGVNCFPHDAGLTVSGSTTWTNGVLAQGSIYSFNKPNLATGNYTYSISTRASNHTTVSAAQPAQNLSVDRSSPVVSIQSSVDCEDNQDPEVQFSWPALAANGCLTEAAYRITVSDDDGQFLSTNWTKTSSISDNPASPTSLGGDPVVTAYRTGSAITVIINGPNPEMTYSISVRTADVEGANFVNQSPTAYTASQVVTCFWHKLSNASYHNFGGLNNPIPTIIGAFDNDDSGERLVVIGTAGVVTTDGEIKTEEADVSLVKWSKTGYNNAHLLSPSSFLSYVKSRKEYESNPSSIQDNKISVFDSNRTINDAVISDVNNGAVIVVNGNATIEGIGNQFNAGGKSLAVVATGTLSFDSSLEEARGIFVAQTIDFATGSDYSTIPLKIIGNVISAGDSDTFQRRREVDRSKPSIFIVINPEMYIDLLSLLSTAKYEWKQLQ